MLSATCLRPSDTTDFRAVSGGTGRLRPQSTAKTRSCWRLWCFDFFQLSHCFFHLMGSCLFPLEPIQHHTQLNSFRYFLAAAVF